MLRSRCAFALALVLGGCVEDSCFVAGTRVATPTGPRASEELEVGDEVIAFVPETGGTVVRRVARVMRRRVCRTRALQFADRTLISTDEHPFYDAEGRRWIPAAELADEHVLVGYGEQGTSPLRVPRFELSFVPVDVFNLSVGGSEQAYFAEGVAVHNKSFATEPPRVRLTNDTEGAVQLDFFGALGVGLSSQRSIRLPADLPRKTVASVTAGAREAIDKLLLDLVEPRGRSGRSRESRARDGIWVGIAGSAYLASDPAASRAVLKFEGSGSTGPDRKIGVLCPKGTANEKHCHEEARRPRQDRPSARFRCDGRGSQPRCMTRS